MGREAPSTHPPSGRATPLTRGVALVHGGQRPISLEYQINCLPPIISDTLVTGMLEGASTSRFPAPSSRSEGERLVLPLYH